jgi:hypothetical protein
VFAAQLLARTPGGGDLSALTVDLSSVPLVPRPEGVIGNLTDAMGLEGLYDVYLGITVSHPSFHLVPPKIFFLERHPTNRHCCQIRL